MKNVQCFLCLNQVIEDAIKNGFRIANGKAVADAFLDRIFSTSAGPLYIGASGQAIRNICVLDLSTTSGTFQVICKDEFWTKKIVLGCI